MNDAVNEKSKNAEFAAHGPNGAIVKRISQHAVIRFRQRTGSNLPDAQVRLRILTILANSEEVRMKRWFRLKAMMDHGLARTRYFRKGRLVIVVADQVVVTIHNGAANRWKPMR